MWTSSIPKDWLQARYFGLHQGSYLKASQPLSKCPWTTTCQASWSDELFCWICRWRNQRFGGGTPAGRQGVWLGFLLLMQKSFFFSLRNSGLRGVCSLQRPCFSVRGLKNFPALAVVRAVQASLTSSSWGSTGVAFSMVGKMAVAVSLQSSLSSQDSVLSYFS